MIWMAQNKEDSINAIDAQKIIEFRMEVMEEVNEVE